MQFLKEFEKILEDLEGKKNEIHDSFRIFLSSNPHN